MKSLYVLFGALLVACSAIFAQTPDYVLVIHGGAGAMKRSLMSEEQEQQYRAGLQAALDAGESVLEAGGTSMDAVETTIRVMEENPLFNAGKGAVFTNAETVELDASFMDGKSGHAGAVAGVKTVRHPISAARLVMDSSEHVMMAGSGAEQFAAAHELEMVDNAFFQTPRRLQQVRNMKAKEAGESLDKQEEPVLKKHGTVGAIALDKYGNLAAGTSTGGMTNKRFGRVGDSPIIGAGTYADNATCAVSCTGHGEFFIRNVIAYQIAAQMEYAGKSVGDAANFMIHENLQTKGGTGGLIALDAKGNIAMPFNTDGMFRAFVNSKGETEVAIYRE
ncbi:MAG: isoaspartyl peptidase/L-asparaginase [Bacteroidota bacterium]